MSFATSTNPWRQGRRPLEQWQPEIARGNDSPISGAVLGRKLSVISAVQQTGFHGTNGHHGSEPGPDASRPLSTQGLSADRIAEARRVWSRAYSRVISEDEAIAILMNVRIGANGREVGNSITQHIPKRGLSKPKPVKALTKS